ncbi:MAG: UDP-3-O-(3-hydroxymyristoyl)glucosamine N-acyltransferase, partial [Gammaproteobacteria bacterium]
MASTLGEIAEQIKANLHGDPACLIKGLNTLQGARKGELSFLSNRRYLRFLKTTNASAVILSMDDLESCPVNALVMEDPYLGYARAATYLYPAGQPSPVISQNAVINSETEIDETVSVGPNAVIGSNVSIGSHSCIGPGCVIGDNVSIGDNAFLHANVTLVDGITVGSRVILHPGVVVGSDGFGLARDKEKWVKIPQIGSVRIGDDVEIGANSTIDRGALDDTVIEDGVKIDNQVQIGHNVRIGAHTAIAGCVGVAGSASIGRRCMIGGAAAIGGHLEIVDDVIITGMSSVANSIRKAGTYSSGMLV